MLGPPPTSGTRDAFVELVMEEGCSELEGAKALGLEGKACQVIREDGKYVEAGENDNLIVQKLAQNKAAFGIFGFSFLEENRDKVQAATIDGAEAKRDQISSGEYPVSRSLFFYTKNAHLEEVDGMEEYVDMFLSDQMISDRGYLKGIGLIPMPEDKIEKERSEWEERAKVSASDLKG